MRTGRIIGGSIMSFCASVFLPYFIVALVNIFFSSDFDFLTFFSSSLSGSSLMLAASATLIGGATWTMLVSEDTLERKTVIYCIATPLLTGCWIALWGAFIYLSESLPSFIGVDLSITSNNNIATIVFLLLALLVYLLSKIKNCKVSLGGVNNK